MKNEEIKEAIAKYLESKELVFWSYPAEYIEDVKTDVGVAFRKGAEWMAGQGVTSEGEILDVSGRPLADRVIRTVSIKDMEQCLKDFNEGDKVVVQIRKK